MKVESFNIELKSLSWGTEEILLRFDTQLISFSATYMGLEPISSLIYSLVSLEHEIDNEDFTRYKFAWCDEPGTLDFEIHKANYNDYILVRIKYDNCASDPYHKNDDWEFEMHYSLYRKTILEAALKVLNKYGLNGFSDSWADGKDTFPLCSLVSLLGAKSTYQKDGDCYCSDIFKELTLLKDSINKMS